MTEEQNTGDEPGADGSVAKRAPAPTARVRAPRPSGEGGEDAAADESTSPFPYAEKFEDWVADETAAPEGQPEGR